MTPIDARRGRPITPRRLATLAGASPLDYLDATPAAEARLDADLLNTTPDALSEAAAKKKRSLLAEVVGSKWARALDRGAKDVERSFLKTFGLAPKDKGPLPDVTRRSREAASATWYRGYGRLFPKVSYWECHRQTVAID